MGLLTALRLNMTNIADPNARHGDRYQAALEMAEYADRSGFTAVSAEEHHLAATGWLPSPLILAAAVAGRTRKVRISINALIVPLYDPIRLAEDVAVLDNITQGRFSFVAGMGYRPEEYHAAGKDWLRRGVLMDHCLSVLLQAWRDEPFEYQGKRIDVTPKPHTRPHPIVFVGDDPSGGAAGGALRLPFATDANARLGGGLRAGVAQTRQDRLRLLPRKWQYCHAAARRSRRSLVSLRRFHHD